MTHSSLVPLCVDLDGTLVRTDMLHETVIMLAKQSPLDAARIPLWLMRGKANLKHRVAEQVSIDAANLPYRASVIELINTARRENRPVVLVTASSKKVAQAVADHLGLFDDVLSSDAVVNLSAHRKADLLAAAYGDRGFDYIGNSRDDFPVFQKARRAYLVGGSRRLRAACVDHCKEVSFLEETSVSLLIWFRALRVHQWLKNSLILVPLLAAHELGNIQLLLYSVLAFLSFSLCASSVYVLNDLLDLPSDRQHPRKSRRPFASGQLPVWTGAVAAPTLLAFSIALASFLPSRFLGVLALYYFVTSLYSFKLKRQVIVDVVLLSGLYTMRIFAGAAATGIRLSFWLLGLSMFFFLSLAMVKRYSELRQKTEIGVKLAGRGYSTDDLPVILSLGTSSGMVSVLILALYTQAETAQNLYPTPEWLWLLPPITLYWVARIWSKAQRGEVDDDPVLFAAKDWQSLIAVSVMALVMVLATYKVEIW